MDLNERELQISKVPFEKSCGVHFSVLRFLLPRFCSLSDAESFWFKQFQPLMICRPRFASRCSQVNCPLSKACCNSTFKIRRKWTPHDFAIRTFETCSFTEASGIKVIQSLNVTSTRSHSVYDHNSFAYQKLRCHSILWPQLFISVLYIISQ